MTECQHSVQRFFLKSSPTIQSLHDTKSLISAAEISASSTMMMDLICCC